LILRDEPKESVGITFSRVSLNPLHMLHPQYQTLNLRELMPERSLRLTRILAIGTRDRLEVD